MKSNFYEGPTVVRVYLSCESKNAFTSSPIKNILENIETGGYIASGYSLQELTAKARELAAQIVKGKPETKVPYDEFKRKMVPAIMTNALFEKGRKSTDPHSFQEVQYVMFDIDKMEDVVLWLEDLHENPSKYDMFYAAYISLSGNGLHILVAVRGLTDENFKDCYKYIASEIEIHYHLSVDMICCDIARLCILSYDPNIFINEQAEVWDAQEIMNTLKMFELIPDEEKEILTQESKNKGLALYIEKMNIQMVEGSRHNTIVSAAGKLNRAGFDKEAVKMELRQFVEPGFEEKEINSIVDSVYKNWKDQHGKGREKWEEERRQNLRNGQFGQNGQYTLQIDEEKFFSHIWEKQPEITEYESCLPKLVWNAVDRNKPEERTSNGLCCKVVSVSSLP